MTMNQYRRNIKRNQTDCFKPWQTQRIKSCSPLRYPKRPADMYRVAFADNCNQSRIKFPSRRNDSLNAVFVSHLRRQFPKVTYHPQFNMMYKQRKDNQNSNIKQSYNEEGNQNLIEKETKLKYNRRSNRKNTVYFEGSNTSYNRFYSSSDTNISSNLNTTPCRNRSVKNVIQKFNRLLSNNESPKQTTLGGKKDCPSIKQIKEDSISIKLDNEKKTEENRNHKNNKKLLHSPQKIESGFQLRSQRLKFTNNQEHSNAYCDDLLEMFKPKVKEEETTEKVPLMPRKSVVKFKDLEIEKNAKELVSSQTQTTPCPSSTNIMINVYNHKSPRSVQQRHMKQINPIEIKISQDKEKNTMLSITQDKEMCEIKEGEISKKSVKSCIEKFEGIKLTMND